MKAHFGLARGSALGFLALVVGCDLGNFDVNDAGASGSTTGGDGGGGGTGGDGGTSTSTSTSGSGGGGGSSSPWTHSYGATVIQLATDVDVDQSGNVVVGGCFEGILDFGGDCAAMDSVGTSAGFVAKFAPEGSCTWSSYFPGGKAAGCTDDPGDMGSVVRNVATNALGDVFFTGFFAQTVDFGDGQPVTSQGGADIVIGKLDASTGGTFWKHVTGGVGQELGTSVAADSKGGVLATGYFSEPDTIDLVEPGFPHEGNTYGYIAKLGANGTKDWAWGMGGTAGGNSLIYAYGVAVDRSDNVLLTGQFNDDLNIDGHQLSRVGIGGHDIYVIKLEPNNGIYQWGRAFGDGADQGGRVIATDYDGNALVTGPFAGNLKFGPSVPTLTSSSPNYDTFFVKLTSGQGEAIWARQLGNSDANLIVDLHFGVAVDPFDNTLVAGGFRGVSTLSGQAVGSKGGLDIYAGALGSTDGATLWSTTAGDAGDSQYATAIASDPDGNIVVVGNFNGSIDFGSGVQSAGAGSKIFIAKLPPVASQP